MNDKACLFCASDNITTASFPRTTRFNEKNFSYKRCKDCELIFLDPLPDIADYSKMYAASYHNQFYFKDEAPDYSQIYNLVEAQIKERKIVDYGCGDGSFIKFFSKKDYRCIGVEYDTTLVEQLKKENPVAEFYTVDEFWGLENENKFPAIYMGDVLEHIATPASFIKNLVDKLGKDGLLIAQGPLENNANLALNFRKLTSSLVSRLNEAKTASHVPYHIFFSNASNQEEIFRKNKLETILYKVYETPWPFPSAFKQNVLQCFQFLIARISILFSKFNSGKMGNRFIYIGKK